MSTLGVIGIALLALIVGVLIGHNWTARRYRRLHKLQLGGYITDRR